MAPSRTTLWRRRKAALTALEKEVEAALLREANQNLVKTKAQGNARVKLVTDSFNISEHELLHSEYSDDFVDLDGTQRSGNMDRVNNYQNDHSDISNTLSDTEQPVNSRQALLPYESSSLGSRDNDSPSESSCFSYMETEIQYQECDQDRLEKLRSELAVIKCKHNLTNVAIADVAKLLRCYTKINIPVDARTICRTDVATVVNPNYIYLGLEKQIRRMIEHRPANSLPKTLNIHIFTDGLKLYNNSNKVIWPILCSIVNIGDYEPFLIACHCGDTKPQSLESFWRPFINEYLTCKGGMRVRDKTFNLKLAAIIADAQARSYIKQTKGQAGYGGCERCTTKGQRIGHTMVFLDFDATLRDNDSFRSQKDGRHHIGRSPLEDIKEIDMIFMFPYDYMHLVCLGSCKRLLGHLWVGAEAKKPHRFSPAQRKMFNSGIIKCATCLPTEFRRKCRVDSELRLWKAVEYRTFLLYSGPIILKPILPKEKYEQFLFLHVAIRLLCSEDTTPQKIKFAEECLRYSVYLIAQLYGSNELVFCNHSLIHLAEDCQRQQANLDFFSAFRYESYLGKLKRLIKGNRNPLAQLKRRISELHHVKSSGDTQEQLFIPEKGSPKLQSIKPGRLKDSFCMSPCGRVYKINKITKDEVIGEVLPRSVNNTREFEEFFVLKLDCEMVYKASQLGVIIVRNKGRPFRACKLSFMNSTKCVRFDRDATTSVIYPMLHHVN